MRESEKASSSNSIAFILFSLNARTSLTGTEWKGYAGNTRRLDIPVRTTYMIYSSIGELYSHIEFSIVLYGNPEPPLHIHLTGDFYEDKKFRTERELMRYFIKEVYGSKTRGRGWWKERKGLMEVIIYYMNAGFKPVLLREGDEVRIPSYNKPVYIMGTDCDIPVFYVERMKEMDTVSLGRTSYLTSHVALTVSFINMLSKKVDNPIELINC